MTIKEYVAAKKIALTDEIKDLTIKPSFIIMQVNEDEASNAYVRGKLKDADEVGIRCELKKYPLDISEEELIMNSIPLEYASDAMLVEELDKQKKLLEAEVVERQMKH